MFQRCTIKQSCFATFVQASKIQCHIFSWVRKKNLPLKKKICAGPEDFWTDAAVSENLIHCTFCLA